MSIFRFLPTPAHDVSIWRVMTQEAFMNGGQIVASWKQLKDKVVFEWGRSTYDNGKHSSGQRGEVA